MSVNFSRDTNKYRVTTHCKFKLRTCEFRDCQEPFMGLQSHKYCPEHRKSEYKQDKYYYISEPEDTNIVYNHKLTYSARVKFKCACCNKEYEVTIIPSVYIYPKFCSEHRSEFKRNLFVGELK